MRIYSLVLGFSCREMPASITDPIVVFYVQTIKPGQWNYVVWEIPNFKRDQVTEFRISQSLHGHDPEVDGIVTYDIDGIELQKIDAEKYAGWEPAPENIAYNHAGYRPGRKKTAIASIDGAPTFQLIEARTGRAVLEKEIAAIRNPQGDFAVMDFSEVTDEGTYLLRRGSAETRPFVIADSLWRQSIYKAINFHFCERCGYDVPTVHRVCHRDLQGMHNGEKKIINGGWHDAADFSQGSFRTGMSIYAMMRIVDQLDKRGIDAELRELIVSEALWGLDWLLKTRFGDGYRITWNTIRIYTDGIIGTIDDVITPARNDPFENFLAAAVEAFSYTVLRERNRRVAEECLQAAKEDWAAAAGKQEEWIAGGDLPMGTWGATNGMYLTASWGITSSIHLYRITGDDVYAAKALEYAGLLLACQEREFRGGIPLTGYFYTGPEKKSILHHLHAAFEESPLIALMELCAEFPDDNDWIEWYGALTLHSEYFLKRGSRYSAPYNMLPNSVFRRSEFDAIEGGVAREEMLRQFYEGARLTDVYYLRRFPVWGSRLFHGGTAVHLSESMALTAAMHARNSGPLETLAEEQLAWILGRNPFSQSLMYGEGYDYLTYHAHRQRDFVGALPVGMDCLANDVPYWSGSNSATRKEIWIVPVSRFLWNAAYLGMPACVTGTVSGQSVSELVFYHHATQKNYSIPVKGDGSFCAVVPPGEYTVFFGDARLSISTVAGGNYTMDFNPGSHIDFSLQARENDSESGSLNLAVSAKGKGKHSFELRLFNADTDEPVKRVDLESGSGRQIMWNIKIRNADAPWTAVIIPDGNISRKVEYTGTLSGR